jgi:hypothetical protein
MEDVNIVVTSSGLVEEALSDEHLEKLNEEANLYRSNDHIPESLYHPSGKERRRTRRMLELRKRKGRL